MHEMNERAEMERLARYVAGECSEQEEAELRAWAGGDPSRLTLLETAQAAWDAAGWPAGSWDAERALPQVKGALARPAPDRLRGRERMAPAARRSAYSQIRPGWAVIAAAVLAGVGFLGAEYFARGAAAPAPVAVQEMVTEKGQRARIRLADGTQVVLGPASRLAMLQDYGVSAREVRLWGEAYFDVVADPARPFRVFVGTSVTQVLGTQFGIRAYPEDPAVRVVVAEGAVSLRPADQEAEGATLEAGELGELSRGAAEVIARVVDPDVHLAWRDGRLAFENTPLTDVTREIERWYGVPVRVGESSIGSLRLTASFRDQSLEVVLDVVAASLDVRWKRVGQTYVFGTRKTTLLADR